MILQKLCDENKQIRSKFYYDSDTENYKISKITPVESNAELNVVKKYLNRFNMDEYL